MAIDEAKLNELPGRSDVGTTAPPQPPIGPYRRLPVQVHHADPDAPEVARRLITLIATRWPATPAEHVGSTAVPDLAGKGIIDLLLAAPPGPHPGHHPGPTRARLPTPVPGGVPSHPAHALGHLPPPGHPVPGPCARGPSLVCRPGPAPPLCGSQAGRLWPAGRLTRSPSPGPSTTGAPPPWPTLAWRTSSRAGSTRTT